MVRKVLRARVRTSAPLAASLIAALVLVLPACCSGSNLNDDGELLMAIKPSFLNGDTVLSSWDLAMSSPCVGWKGVSCGQTQSYEGRPRPDYQRVTMVLLTGAGLQGSIPDPGWELPEWLERLELDDNAVQGSLPKSWNLPTVLVLINLDNCSLVGPIPDMQDWVLPTAVPKEFNDGGKLQLHIPRNSLSGTLPPLDDLEPGVLVGIKPGNPGLCGEVPEVGYGRGASRYYEDSSGITVSSLPKCTEVPSPDPESPAPAPSPNPSPPPDSTDTELQEALRGICTQFLGCQCPGAT